MAQTIEAKRQIRIPYILRLVIFWLVIFALYRILFLAFNINSILKTGVIGATHSLIAGFSLDLATISFLLFPSFLLWTFNQFLKNRIYTVLNSVYTFSVLVVFSILAISNIKMHHEWGSLLNFGVFDYLYHPEVVVSFISTTQLILLSVFIAVYFLISLLIYKKIVTNFSAPITNIFVKTISIILTIALLPVMARGGLQLAPINESAAYFSETTFYNHVAINPAWYFMHSYLDRKPAANPYMFMDSALAEGRTKKLFSRSDTSAISILTESKPNIVIIILESWTADIIQSLGGENSITPNFDTLSKTGLLFTQVYGAGSRTEHGLISVLSGYPPPPLISIITIPAKSEKLTSLSKVLTDDGYASSFFYGGESGFANMKSYLVSSHFQNIVDKASFPKNQWNSKWGAHDQYVLEKQLMVLKTMPEPFFSVLLTLSSHEPFEVPMQTPFDDDHSEPGKFRKAAYYSDHC
ncbi:MAG: sulfatase-like hydrolase/transferase, partial [Saprospiraceae bacterium]